MLAVWREACRHVQIAESVKIIARTLSRPMSIDQLVIRRIDEQLHHIETLAVGLPTEEHWRSDRHSTWSAADIRTLARWCRRRETLCRQPSTRQPALAAAAIPAWLSGHVLVGPLIGKHGTLGLLMVRRQSDDAFSPREEQAWQTLLEPLAVALENDRRFHEIQALREAAEADKRSALSRLGRVALNDSIIGADGGLKPVMERVALVARTHMPVLLLGETGTGKEVVARAIHDQSSRRDGPFIRVNCGAIAPELIDSELFGHERGAFTGATTTRHGWFERADKGTLLLDEIGELPLPAQVRLLRVLQEQTFERVGGERPVRIDVRIVASTHRDLAAMVQNGRFREDLWYRIAGMAVILPPLRERHEDIPALVEHFAGRAATHFGLTPRQPSPDDLQLLANYRWPGNIRELASVIDRAAILGDGEGLEISQALGVIPPAAMTTTPLSARTTQPDTPPSPIEVMSLDDATRHHIEAALTATQGRVEGPHGAANRLAINPHTLRGRMRKLGIDWKRFRDAG